MQIARFPFGREQAPLPLFLVHVRADASEEVPGGMGDPHPPTELEAWIASARRGDHHAMELIIKQFQDRVWRRARYRIGDPDEAWEVSQEVFMICLRKLHQYRGEAPFWYWLARIVDNQVRNRQNWWRRRKRASTFSLDDLGRNQDGEPTGWEPADTGPSPGRQAADRESIDALEQSLAQMRPLHREVLLLRFADGQDYEQIAQTLGISLGTVKSRINRARTELRTLMKDHF